MTSDSQEYLDKKRFYNSLLTIYGRKPALEAISTSGVKIHRIHLADSNKPAKILNDIIALAEKQNAEILYHSRKDLSRISKNSKQDQGIAVDLIMPGFENFEDVIKSIDSEPQDNKKRVYIALDRVTNPQNLGMIIRSVCASPIDGLLIAEKGTAKLDSLVIKASAGTIFKAKIIRCQNLADSLKKLRAHRFDVVALDVNAPKTMLNFEPDNAIVYVLGNETDGLSQEVTNICNKAVKIPMANNVESLNVAVTASLLAFRSVI